MQRTDADGYDISLLDQLADEVDRSVTDVKRIVRDLRPTALDDQSLPAALVEFARSCDGVIKFDSISRRPLRCFRRRSKSRSTASLPRH